MGTETFYTEIKELKHVCDKDWEKKREMRCSRKCKKDCQKKKIEVRDEGSYLRRKYFLPQSGCWPALPRNWPACTCSPIPAKCHQSHWRSNTWHHCKPTPVDMSLYGLQKKVLKGVCWCWWSLVGKLEGFWFLQTMPTEDNWPQFLEWGICFLV